ncbi:hypothetical protein D3C73_996010 [compost metagenome]
MVSSAVGPITAMRLRVRDSGSTPSFFSNTSDSWAAFRASASCAGAWFTDAGIRAQRTRSGGSNMPSRIRAANRRVTASSISASLIRPCRTAAGSVAYSWPHSSSVPFLTANAAAASRLGTIR